jgi:hypothetical protein
MNMILDKLSVLEEVEALHAIILHAGEMLYDRVPLNDIVRSLQARCRDTPMMSVVGKMAVYQIVQHKVQVCTHLSFDWHQIDVC